MTPPHTIEGFRILSLFQLTYLLPGSFCDGLAVHGGVVDRGVGVHPAQNINQNILQNYENFQALRLP